MEVYIDNQKTNFGRRSNDLEKILKAISKKLEKHEKVIQNIYINGSNIQDSIILDIDMDRPNIMEVETKSYTDLILDSLTISKEYTETFFEVKKDFQQLIEDNEKISGIEIEETDSFLNWFSDLLFFLVENYAFAFRSLQETMQTFREELITLDELKEKKDYITYVSTLDYCIADILENFKTNIDYYYKSILEEVEQKKIVF
ncbi:chemotaxis protein [Fusobacterium polymorphum]|uniref:chemotaxis protein n=1 Tax=Fusobacterium nucleatum subsp. polymorphum TaxID=76857 RepID=UPI002B4C09A3|nr:chemotaxis protein [Fusobacterium polymorphum]WRL77139.1 chemotaxis protein [Fusobacterium polymorphum]